jgi:LacI family transcriptional regulator
MGIDFRRPIPLYQQISEDLRKSILNGTLQVGAMIASQQELAQRYDVSLITVKKALSELIREGVLYSRVGKGTYVARKPAGFQISKTQTVGIVLRDLSSPFFSLIVKGIEASASHHGYNVLVSSTSNVAEKEESQIRHFSEMGVSGLIIASMTHVYSASEALRHLHEQSYPYVVVSYLEDPDIYRVGNDHEGGAYMAAKHLLDIGYRRIGYVNGEEGNMVGELRRRGYAHALLEAGVSPRQEDQFRLNLRGEWNDYQSGAEIGAVLAAGADRPEAFLVYNDLSALGLIQSLLNNGIKVPDDIAIVGYDDISSARYGPVPLTTVRQSTFEIGAMAFDVLLRRIGGQSPEIITTLRPSLIIRDSCGAKKPRGRSAS